LLLVLGGAAVFFVGWRFSKRASQIPLSHRAIATQVLAEYLGSNAPSGKVLVFSNPFSQMSGRPAEVYNFEKAGIEGLRRGFGAKTDLRISFPQLRPEAINNPGSIPIDSATKTPLSFFVEDNSFDELVAKNKDCQVAVSLIGLPLRIQSSAAWKALEAPRFGLLLPDWRMIGDAKMIREAFENGKLLAAVVAKPGGAPEDAPATGDYRTEFGNRFILVTKANIDSLLASNSSLFN